MSKRKASTVNILHKFRKATLLDSKRGGFVIAFNYASYSCERSTSSKTPNVYSIRSSMQKECPLRQNG